MAASEVDGAALKFDVETAWKHGQAVLVGDKDIDIDSYIQTWKEINNFFQLMGAVFGFVASDVKTKIGILEELRKGNDGENFSTLKKMVKYEVEADLLRKSAYVSGCRTFLRLHRGLDFVRTLLQKISELEDNDKITAACQESYDATLAKHHTWLIKKGAGVAMHALPTREKFLQKMCGGPEDVAKALALLPQFLAVAKEAFDRAEKIYTDNKLHDLP